jgi:hypothetical protein
MAGGDVNRLRLYLEDKILVIVVIQSILKLKKMWIDATRGGCAKGCHAVEPAETLPQRRREPDLHPKVAWPELSEVMATKAKRSDAAVAIILSPRHPHNRVCSRTCTTDQSVFPLFDIRLPKKAAVS